MSEMKIVHSSVNKHMYKRWFASNMNCILLHWNAIAALIWWKLRIYPLQYERHYYGNPKSHYNWVCHQICTTTTFINGCFVGADPPPKYWVLVHSEAPVVLHYLEFSSGSDQSKACHNAHVAIVTCDITKAVQGSITCPLNKAPTLCLLQFFRIRIAPFVSSNWIIFPEVAVVEGKSTFRWRHEPEPSSDGIIYCLTVAL